MKKIFSVVLLSLVVGSSFAFTWPGSAKKVSSKSSSTTAASDTATASGKIVYATPDKTIVISKPSDVVQLLLPSNATTGYRWMLASMDRNILQLQSAQYIAPHTKLIGASGYEKWRFCINANNVTGPTVTKIKLLYARPWEAQNATDYSTFTVVILQGFTPG